MPSSDPLLRLDASIICATLLKKASKHFPAKHFDRQSLPTQIVNFLIDTLTNNEEKFTLYSILIALGEAASSNYERSNDMVRRDILTLIQTCHTAAEGDIDIIRAIMRTLSGLFGQKVRIQNSLSTLPLLSASLHSTDVKTISYAAYAVSSLLENISREVLVADVTIAPTLTQLMLHPAKEVVTPALRGVGNIMTGDDHQTQMMINLQVIPSLLWLVDYPDKEVQKEAVWTLSNITAGNQLQIQAVIDAGVIPKVIPLLEYWKTETKAEKDLFKETMWLFSNICERGTPSQKRFILNEKMLEKFYELLQNHIEIKERSLISLLMNSFKNLLSEGLQTESNESTRILIKTFLEKNEVTLFFENTEFFQDFDVYDILDIIDSLNNNDTL